MDIDHNSVTIGQWADYIDTGIWTFENGYLVSPPDLTLDQLKDHLLAAGGGVFLGQDGRFRWVQ